ncbi:hypothetical protein BDW66DRAFT_17014 [Aspergillus desertorum]
MPAVVGWDPESVDATYLSLGLGTTPLSPALLLALCLTSVSHILTAIFVECFQGRIISKRPKIWVAWRLILCFCCVSHCTYSGRLRASKCRCREEQLQYGHDTVPFTSPPRWSATGEERRLLDAVLGRKPFSKPDREGRAAGLDSGIEQLATCASRYESVALGKSAQYMKCSTRSIDISRHGMQRCCQAVSRHSVVSGTTQGRSGCLRLGGWFPSGDRTWLPGSSQMI